MKSLTFISGIFATLVIVIVAHPAYALSAPQATIQFTPSASSPHSFSSEIWIEAGDTPINAIEGTLQLPKGIDVQSVSVANSSMTQWLQEPYYVPSKNSISFAGGVMEGIAPHQKARLFTLYGSSTQMTAANFSLTASAYSADGTGAQEQVKTVTVTTPAAAVTNPAINDHTPPKNLVVDIGRDASLFNNQYFLSMSAVDAESGIDHFEVKEGLNGVFHRVDSLYVLKNDPGSTYIEVHAVDKAGNVAVYRSIPQEFSNGLYVLVGLSILGFALFRVFITRA